MMRLECFDVARHVPDIVRIKNADQPGSLTEADARAWFERMFAHERAASEYYCALAAGDSVGTAGYVELAHSVWHQPGEYGLELIVDPACRGRGIGRLLWADALARARERGATRLRTSVANDRPADIGFVERRGFARVANQFDSELDLATFDERRFADIDAAIARLTSDGLRFTSMAELGDGEAVRRKLHALNASSANDIPGRDADAALPPFAAFNRDVCEQPWYQPAGQIVAVVAGTGEFAGMCAVTVRDDKRAHNLHTGVAREWRGRKLAQALKLIAIRYARGRAATRIDTNNDSRNAPMLAINRKFGYRRKGGRWQCELVLQCRS